MVGNARALFGVLGLALVAACQSGTTGAPAPAQPAPAPDTGPVAAPADDATTADGIYTVVQAQRGKDLYDAVCSECHDTEDWIEAGFRGRWEDQSVFQLWYYINDRMPYDDPWSLTRQQVTDVVAYILELNGLPTGDTELGTDDDTIDNYWIAWDAR